jgi:hypothetical protein
MFARRMEGMSIITTENEGGRSSVSVTTRERRICRQVRTEEFRIE